MVSHSFTKENLGRAMVQLPPEADILPVPSETRRPEKTPEIVTGLFNLIPLLVLP
jgi:hypothetical protein